MKPSQRGGIDFIQDAVKALLIQDADALVNAVMGMGAASEKTDRTMLTRDAEMFIQKYECIATAFKAVTL